MALEELEQFKEEIVRRLREEADHTELVMELAERIIQLTGERDTARAIAEIREQSIQEANAQFWQMHATAQKATEAMNKVTADWQKLLTLEEAVLHNPLDGAAKRRRDAYIRQKAKKFRDSDQVQ